MARNDAVASPGDAGTKYRFDHLAIGLVMGDMRFAADDPGPGDRIPEFDLPTLDGGRFQSADLAEKGPALLVFGSSTCPVTESAGPGLNELHAQFGEQVRFVMVNVREAHPGASVPQPKSAEEKREHAAMLRELHGFDFEVAVDDIDGTLHRALGPKPNSAYVIGKDGTILFRAHWANDTKAIGDALAAVVAERSLRRAKSGGTMRSVMRSLRYVAPVLDRSGKGAWRDMWLVAPPITIVAYAWRLSRRLRGRG